MRPRNLIGAAVFAGMCCGGAYAQAVDVGAPVATVAASAGLPEAAAVAVPRQASWAVRLPQREVVDFRGMADFDKAGIGPGGMAYPAVGGVAGLVVGILTHAAVSESVKSAEKNRIREQADRVLDPYRDTLASFSHQELVGQGLSATPLAGQAALLPAGQEAVEADWVLDVAPVFYMTQDQSALVLDAEFLISKRGATKEEAYRNTVRVVSAPVKDVQALHAHWHEGAGARLKAVSADLFAQSVTIAHKDALQRTAQTKPARTVRYAEGKSEKMERGEVIEDCCDRVVLRNLRGWLMSVPARATGTSSPALIK